MAFLPGFEYDLLVSYAHVDNLSATEQPWVEQFHKELEIALAQRIGRLGVVKIWRDKRLEGDQLFDQTIKDAIDKSALFVALTSKGYLTSDYCQQELKWFHKKAGAEAYSLQIGDRSRIYNALLNNIPHDHWPNEYDRITGYPFHKVKLAMQDALLSVHLLNDLAGREIEGEPGKSYPQKQVELARDRARAQLVWVPKSLDLRSVEDESHRTFLDGLENGEREEAHYDFVRGVTASLVPQILEKLEEPQTPSVTEGVAEAVLDFNLGSVPVRLIDNSKSSTIERAALAPLLKTMRMGGSG